MSDSIFGYNGRLSFEIRGKSYTKHNKGTSSLFLALLNILASKRFDAFSLPAYFMVYESTPEAILAIPRSSSHEECLIDFVPIDKEVLYEGTGNNSEPYISLSGLLSPQRTRVNFENAHSLAVVAGNKEDILAVVSLENGETDETILEALEQKSTVLIRWDMFIRNQQDSAQPARLY